MRELFLPYPKSQTLSDFLTWSHYVELLKIEDPLERSFYEKQAEIEKPEDILKEPFVFEYTGLSTLSADDLKDFVSGKMN